MGKLLDNRLNIINAALSTNSTYKKTPSEYFKNTLQDKINIEFENASTLNTIQEELIPGTNIYTDVQVRIEHVVKNELGQKLGDDYRGLIFKNMDHIYGLGYRYQFSNNTWITVFSDYYKFPTASTTIRRANYTLKWINDVGKIIEEPCIIDYFKLSPSNNVEDKQYIRTGSNIRYVHFQNNSETYKLIRDKRFIIDRRAYRCIDFDSVTFSSTLPGLYILTLEEHQFNASTDLLYADGTGIANYYGNTAYTIDITNLDISISSGNTAQLNWVVKYGGTIVTDKTVVFSSSNTSVATVDSSGLVTGVSNGSCAITASLQDNNAIYDTINISVVSSPSQNIVEQISGADSISNGLTSDYSIYKYIDSVIQADTYTWSITGDASIVSYDGNYATVQANSNIGTCILQAQNNISGSIFTKTITLTDMW